MNMQVMNISSIVPENKFDIRNAKIVAEIGYPEIEPILIDLLAWMKDGNWPVYKILQPLMAGIGEPLAAHIIRILKGDDDIWKYWIITDVIKRSPILIQLLKPELVDLFCLKKNSADPEKLCEEIIEIIGEIV